LVQAKRIATLPASNKKPKMYLDSRVAAEDNDGVSPIKELNASASAAIMVTKDFVQGLFSSVFF
jgi:hypothetical protein